ncbi:hypothetical protein FDE82_01960 [Clostridium botulinum]|uniref:hypothetical protein n=1 Tax=Clostridium sporogenes TaxID=1509 RepID=UPI0013C9BF96|nr:hypothetical protein [Clostridium sporogenes]MCR1972663.1 hypothetical protein [Clostridium sporogenes]NFS20901.1 hypothetical protein [Clostridium botulinum]
MKDIFFFRDIENYSELVLKDKTKRASSKNNQNYSVIDKVVLEKNEYEKFLKHINANYDFLYNYVGKMRISKGVWQCVLVTSEGYEGILVMSDGYQYPRFTALFFDENNFNEKGNI